MCRLRDDDRFHCIIAMTLGKVCARRGPFRQDSTKMVGRYFGKIAAGVGTPKPMRTPQNVMHCEIKCNGRFEINVRGIPAKRRNPVRLLNVGVPFWYAASEYASSPFTYKNNKSRTSEGKITERGRHCRDARTIHKTKKDPAGRSIDFD